MDKKVEFFLIKFNDELFGEVMGCDLHVCNENATVADLLQALDEFAAENLADCKGCDACCQERAPLIAADIYALATLLDAKEFPAHTVCRAFAEITVNEGVADITLRRDHDNMCNQLNKTGRFCSIWPQRLFVCRSHFCLPRSDKFSELRSEVVNMGENELTRLLLAEEANGAQPLTEHPLHKLLNKADYPLNAQSNCQRYDQILLKDCLSPQLWQDLLDKQR